ncbi:RNA-binding protein 39 [Caerostris extrusa]|uniref:RNA-binding protein 39 n=1 Tax=Caerostris extrusa TaxID=172846 RepID=A0AAV4UV44_CAEEX|nr:RNA-binding protein 39 [Caerostris extrusa]
MADDFDVEAMLEAPYKKEQKDIERYNGTNSNNKENHRRVKINCIATFFMLILFLKALVQKRKKEVEAEVMTDVVKAEAGVAKVVKYKVVAETEEAEVAIEGGEVVAIPSVVKVVIVGAGVSAGNVDIAVEQEAVVEIEEFVLVAVTGDLELDHHEETEEDIELDLKVQESVPPPRSPIGGHTQFFDSLRNKLPDDDISPEDRDLRTIFCMRLSQKVRARDLEEFFSSVGPVRDVKIIMDNKTRRSKGIAYVEFQSVDSIPLALALNDTELMGYKIQIQLSQAEKNRVAASASSVVRGTPGPMRLYVGSLHFNITEDMLRGIFEPFGKIERIELIKDTETNRSKGYGFISFYDSEDAKKALEQLNGFELAGRPMKVGHVTERTDIAQGSFLDSDELDRTGIDLGATGRLQLMAKLAEGTDMSIPAAAVSALQLSQGLVTPQPSITPPIATQCFLLSNMFDPATETNPSWDEEIRNDVIEECRKHGGAMHVFVDRMSPQGLVYVKCPTIAAAVASVTALHGRWFCRSNDHCRLRTCG